jgi:hypothetical protein
MVIEAGLVAREIDEVLGRALPRPVGPIARGAKRGELLIQLDEGDHALAGGGVQLKECELADCLVAEAAPGKADGEHNSNAAVNAASLAMRTLPLPAQGD